MHDAWRIEIILNFTAQDFFVVTLEGEARP
jgi:hypothetical protein